jgi:hypothetical protein
MAEPGQGNPNIAVVDDYLEGVAKYLLGKLYGPGGPPWGTSLTQIEDLLLALQQALCQHCFSLALTRQAEQLPNTPEACRQCPSCQQPLSCADSQPRSTQTRAGLARWTEPVGHCSHCRRDFFPQSRALGIDQAEFSPGLLRKIISVGSRCRSFAEADDLLRDLSGLDIGPKQIERLIHKIGQERIEERDAAVQRFEQLPLPERFAVPKGVTAPDLAVVMTDGGRLQIRKVPAPTAAEPAVVGPGAEVVLPSSEPMAEASDPPAGVQDAAADQEKKSKHWREDKIGLLLCMESKPSANDPCPVLPPGFLDRHRIPKLAREIRKKVRQGEEAAEPSADPEVEEAALAEKSKYTPPKPGKRKVVASRMPWPLFALVVAEAAWALGFQGAKRKAFVGDGSDNNWSIQQRFFGSFVAILDFIHALSYVYAAAQVGRDRVQGWRVYCRWIERVWSGQVAVVIEELAMMQEEVGLPEESDGETHPRVLVAETLGYLRNQADKMKYPEYRQAGLPITSSLVESTVKQFNHRVKGTEKFWTEEGAEAMLVLRADQLSTVQSMDAFWQRRQEEASGQRRYRQTKRTRQSASRPQPQGGRKSASQQTSSKKSISR